jgi:hypothetical protein
LLEWAVGHPADRKRIVIRGAHSVCSWEHYRDRSQDFTKPLHFADKPAAAPVFTFRTQLILRPQPHEPSGAFNIGY